MEREPTCGGLSSGPKKASEELQKHFAPTSSRSKKGTNCTCSYSYKVASLIYESIVHCTVYAKYYELHGLQIWIWQNGKNTKAMDILGLSDLLTTLCQRKKVWKQNQQMKISPAAQVRLYILVYRSERVEEIRERRFRRRCTKGDLRWYWRTTTCFPIRTKLLAFCLFLSRQMSNMLTARRCNLPSMRNRIMNV